MQLNEFSNKKTQLQKVNNWLIREYKTSLKTSSISKLKESLTQIKFRRNKIVNESTFNSYHKDKNYVKYLMLEKALELKIAASRKTTRLSENEQSQSQDEIAQAELLLAGQAIVDKLSKMVEDLAKSSVSDLMPIVDEMKYKFGPEIAEQFSQSMKAALETAQQAAETAKDEAANAIMAVQGFDTGAAPDMGADDLGDMGDDDMDMGDDFEDDFDGADAASGEIEEPLGRSKRR